MFIIADHPTPKTGYNKAFTLSSRDYKNAQCVIYQMNSSQDGGFTEIQDKINAIDSGAGRVRGGSQILIQKRTESQSDESLDVGGGIMTETAPSILAGTQNGDNQASVIIIKDDMDKAIYYAIDGYNGAISAEASALGVNCGMSTGRNGVLACYCLSAYDSNAMKSPNPHSGCYEAETSRTLDNNGGNPACNQGGLIIVNKTNCND